MPGGPCPLTATLTSSGADLASTSDDITISIGASETTAMVIGTVKDKAGVALDSVPVEFYSAVSGTLTTTTDSTDASGNYSFNSVPFGPRAVTALPRFVYSPGSLSGTTTVTFTIINYSTTAQTIDRMMVTFGGGGTYNRIRINTGAGLNTIFTSGGTNSGADVNVTDTLVTASSTTRPSMRVFIDSPSVQVPDTLIMGQGTTAVMDIRFQQGMAGTPITVTINPSGANPISVLNFIP